MSTHIIIIIRSTTTNDPALTPASPGDVPPKPGATHLSAQSGRDANAAAERVLNENALRECRLEETEDVCRVVV